MGEGSTVSRAMYPPLLLIANARMPSQRAQSLQVAQASAALARAGAATTLLHARRRDTAELPVEALFDHYAVPRGVRPSVEAVPCMDWIDRVPRALQFVPARCQEFSFAYGAAQRAKRVSMETRILTRETEVAGLLRGRPGLFLELHRVPGHALRRRALVGAVEQGARVIAISGGVRQDLLELGLPPEAICVEHDAFEVSRFDSLPSRSSARLALDLAPNRPLVAYVGGLLAWKGVDVLLDAARRLPEVGFLIMGGMDRDVARLRQRAEGLDHVQITGFADPRRAAMALCAADISVVPNRGTPAISARYTSPLKIFEAMAVGLPVVCSDLPSMRDVLDDNMAVFVPPEDSGALAEALDSLLGDDARMRSISSALQAEAPKHTWDARALRILEGMGDGA